MRTKHPLFLISIFCLLVLILVACTNQPKAPGTTIGDPIETPTATVIPDAPTDDPTPSPTDNPSDNPGGFRVKSIGLVMSPLTVYHVKCGAPLTVIYTAVFNLEGNTSGGTITYEYTTNKWETLKKGTLTVEAGKESATFNFSSVELAIEGLSSVYSGIIRSIEPNESYSPLMKPTGTCTKS